MTQEHDKTVRRPMPMAMVIIFTIVVTVLLWEGISQMPDAMAQGRKPLAESDIFAAGKVQDKMLQQQKETNKKLDELITLLKSGKVEVKINNTVAVRPVYKKPAPKSTPKSSPSGPVIIKND